jgi:hypothetical protein
MLISLSAPAISSANAKHCLVRKADPSNFSTIFPETAVPPKIQTTKLSTVIGWPGNGRRNRRNGRLFFMGHTRLHRPYLILLVGMVFILIFG